MVHERVYLTLAQAVYGDLSSRPFEVVSYEYFETMYGLNRNSLKVHVYEVRKKLKPDYAIYGVQGMGYTFTNLPVTRGEIIPIKGIRSSSTEWHEGFLSHREEISKLFDLIQKGLISDRPNIITPVIPDEEYKLLKCFIEAYSCNEQLRIAHINHIQRNVLGRLQDTLPLATNDQWGIMHERNDGLYYLQQMKEYRYPLRN